jgi:hypothetical protein
MNFINTVVKKYKIISADEDLFKKEVKKLSKYKLAGNIDGHKILRFKVDEGHKYYSINVLLDGKYNLHFEHEFGTLGGWSIISHDAEQPTYGQCPEIKFVNRDWSNLSAAIADIKKSLPHDFREKDPNAPHEAGFDLTSIPPENWKKVLKAVGIKNLKPTLKERAWVWSGEGIEIRTGNDPISGKYGAGQKRKDEVGYASYIGLEGTEEKVKLAYKMIKELAESIKEADPHRASYI